MAEATTISERHLQRAVRDLFHNHNYVLVNSYVFDWESDLFSITKTGTVYEVEMKISRADFRKDFEKEKHFYFKNAGAGRIQERDPEVRDSGDHYAWYYDVEAKQGHYAPFCKMKWHDSATFQIPNRFYYACPPGVIPVQDLPKYAGLIHIEGMGATIIKQAPLMHKRNLLDDGMVRCLLKKFWWLSQNMRAHLRYNNIDFKDCSEPNNKE